MPRAAQQKPGGWFYACIRERHSVRHFSDRPVDRRIIEDCLRAAGTVPSGANHQTWHFACVSDPEIEARIRAVEREERESYGGKAGDEWLTDLKKMGTNAHQPFRETVPWLIAIFLERYGFDGAGKKQKHC